MIDLKNLRLIQEFLPEIDLNDSKTVRDLVKLAEMIGEGGVKAHEKNSANYMDKIAHLFNAHGKSFEDVLVACLERQEKSVAKLLEEIAFYKAVALTVHWELEGYKAFVKERGLKPPPPKSERNLRIVGK